MRARTATLSSLTLANYSEFGLIVGAIAVSNAWLTEDWLVTIALALTMTIIIAAPINMRAIRLYDRLRPTARKFETKSVLPEDEPVDIGDAKIAVIGMGQLGTGVYDQLAPDYGNLLIGIDSDPDIIATHKAAGRNVVRADATDDEMWERTTDTPIEVGILALKRHQENLGIVNRVRKRNRNAKMFAVASHEDEVAELIDAGAEAAWNMYSEAGIGLASEVISYYKNKLRRRQGRRVGQFSDSFRLLWVILSKFWNGWERVCHAMKPRRVRMIGSSRSTTQILPVPVSLTRLSISPRTTLS